MSTAPIEGRRSLHIERVDFPNGLTLLLAPNDGIPAFCLQAIVRTGSRYEPDDLAGLASLAGGILNEGTTRRTAQQIAETIEDVGAHLGAFGGYAQSGLRATALSDDLDLVTELAAELLRHPTFPEDRVRLVVERRLGLLRSRADQPRVVASELFDELVFAGHPNHRPSHGYEASVSRITRDHLVEFHRTYYHPNATIIALAGNFDPAAAREAIERRFGDWERNDALTFPDVPEIVRQSTPVERFVSADKAQANIYLGHLGVRRAHPDYYALLVLDTILGSSPGFTSRIPRILRDEQGLAYTTFSNIAGSAGVDPGRFIAYIGTSPTNLDRAVEGLRREISRVVEEPVEIDELDAAKSYLTGSFVFHFQTNAQVAGYLVSAEVHGLGFDYLERYPALVDGVTIQDVLRAARANIDPDAMTLVVVGPVSER
jgi:zinc protease